MRTTETLSNGRTPGALSRVLRHNESRDKSGPLIGQGQETFGFWLADDDQVSRPNEDPSLALRVEILGAWTCEIKIQFFCSQHIISELGNVMDD